MPETSQNEKTALITGCSGHIGLSIAHDLKARGWNIWGQTRDIKKAHGANPNFNWVEIDFTKPDTTEKALLQIPKHIKFDAIIHCAGYSPDFTINNLDEPNYRNGIQVNFESVVKINELLWQNLKQPASIIHFGSRVGIRGNIGQLAYSTAKNLLENYTKLLAQKGGKNNIRVNLIYPGVHDSTILGKNAKQIIENAKNESYLNTLTSISDVINAVNYILNASTVSGQTFAIESRPIE